MCLFFSFLPATFWTIAGYFVLFASSKSNGVTKTFGMALAIWAFLLAGLIILGGVYITIAGACPITELLKCSV